VKAVRLARTPTCDRQIARHRQKHDDSIYIASIVLRGKTKSMANVTIYNYQQGQQLIVAHFH